MKVAICNLGHIVSGDWHAPFVLGNTIVTDAGRIVSVGTAAAIDDADVVIDAGGMTAIPGLIDSHVHVTFGVIWRAICTAELRPRSRPRRCMSLGGRAIRKASRRSRSRHNAVSPNIGPVG